MRPVPYGVKTLASYISGPSNRMDNCFLNDLLTYMLCESYDLGVMQGSWLLLNYMTCVNETFLLTVLRSVFRVGCVMEANEKQAEA